MNKLPDVAQLVVVNHLPDATMFRVVAHQGASGVGLIDATRERPGRTQATQWIDKCYLEWPSPQQRRDFTQVEGVGA